MGSGHPIVEISSSDDEEEEDGIVTIENSRLSRSPASHKRRTASPHSSPDNDVVLIEKSHCSERRTMERSTAVNSASLSLEKNKSPRKTGDDDCCILDNDPEKSVRSVDSQANEADDLVVIGESGPVACRDYPHARYLCAKFPFKTTSHASFCEQCHCYVCDTLAPCLFWGQGKQGNDHCHAFDKEEKWKILRSISKPGPPLRNVISHPLPPRRGRSRVHPRRHSQSRPGATLASSGFSSSMNSVFQDPIFFNAVASDSVWPSDGSYLPGQLRPYIPGMTNAPGFSYSDRTMLPAPPPVTVDSSARAESVGLLPSDHRRLTNQCSNNTVNQNSMAKTSTLCADNANVANGCEAPSAVTSQGFTRCSSICNSTQIPLNRLGTAQKQTQTTSKVASRGPGSCPKDPVERLGGLTHRGPTQSLAISFNNFTGNELVTLRDYLYNGLSEQRDREQQMAQDDRVGGGSSKEMQSHCEKVNVSLAAENSALSGIEPSCRSESHAVQLESRAVNFESGAHMSTGAGQVVQMRMVSNMPGAKQTALEDFQQDLLDQQISLGRETDPSPSLDDILAQLDRSDLWDEFDFTPFNF